MNEYSYPNATPADWLYADQVLPRRAKQACRFTEFLLSNPKASTVEACHGCAIGNLSDIKAKANRYLKEIGLFIGCERPIEPIPNRYGDDTEMFLWSCFRQVNADHLQAQTKLKQAS